RLIFENSIGVADDTITGRREFVAEDPAHFAIVHCTLVTSPDEVADLRAEDAVLQVSDDRADPELDENSLELEWPRLFGMLHVDDRRLRNLRRVRAVRAAGRRQVDGDQRCEKPGRVGNGREGTDAVLNHRLYR